MTDGIRDAALDEAREQALKNERHRLEIVAESSPAAIAITRGPTFVFDLVNAGYLDVFPGRELLGREMFTAIPELAVQGFLEIFTNVFATGKPFVGTEMKAELAYRKGAPVESRYWDIVCVRMDNLDGTPYGVYNSAFDVTDRVRQRLALEAREAELSRNEQRVGVILGSAGAGLWELDVASGVIAADRRVLELMGLPPDSAFDLAKGLDGITTDEDRARVATALEDALAGRNGGRYIAEFRTGGRNGVPLRWVESRAQAFFDAQGRGVRLAGAMIDMTARKNLEEERQRSAARVQQLLETMSDCFFSVDPEWRITAVNAAFEKMSRMQRSEILGRVLWDFFPRRDGDSSGAWTFYQRCMTERVPVTYEAYYPPFDLWTEGSANPTDDGGMAVFFRDVTAAKRAAQALLRQAAFERQLIGIVSHDLRTPLNVVTVASSLLRRRDSLDAASTKHVQRIQNAAERATRLIRDLLDFTQARLGGGIRVNRTPGDLMTLTRAVMDEIEAAHPDRVIVTRWEGDGRGEWDGDRLAQVVQNLVTNALKYSEPTSAVEVTTRGEADRVCLVVHNRGVPIAAEMIPVLFEPFERGEGGDDASARSVGLGLYIVKQIVDAHQGSLDVRSQADEGTTFTVALPR